MYEVLHLLFSSNSSFAVQRNALGCSTNGENPFANYHSLKEVRDGGVHQKIDDISQADLSNIQLAGGHYVLKPTTLA